MSAITMPGNSRAGWPAGHTPLDSHRNADMRVDVYALRKQERGGETLMSGCTKTTRILLVNGFRMNADHGS